MTAIREYVKTEMRRWAEVHGECDTQGIMDDEWDELARVAVAATGFAVAGQEQHDA